MDNVLWYGRVADSKVGCWLTACAPLLILSLHCRSTSQFKLAKARFAGNTERIGVDPAISFVQPDLAPGNATECCLCAGYCEEHGGCSLLQ